MHVIGNVEVANFSTSRSDFHCITSPHPSTFFTYTINTKLGRGGDLTFSKKLLSKSLPQGAKM